MRVISSLGAVVYGASPGVPHAHLFQGKAITHTLQSPSYAVSMTDTLSQDRLDMEDRCSCLLIQLR